MSQSSELGTRGEPAPRPLDWIGTARYEVLRCIARGAMGSVYEAYDRERRQHVAIKRLYCGFPRHTGSRYEAAA